MTVGDRTWVRIRKYTKSYSNPSTVTYGHPENKECTLILLVILGLDNDIKPLTVIKKISLDSFSMLYDTYK